MSCLCGAPQSAPGFSNGAADGGSHAPAEGQTHVIDTVKT